MNPETKNGILDSPYGEITIIRENKVIARVKNGHPVVDGKLRNVLAKHKVPEHWIDRDRDGEAN